MKTQIPGVTIMKAKRYLALLLAAALALGLSACSRPSRRPALPAAPLQSTFKQDEADLGQGETASLQSAPVMKREAAGTAQALAPEQTTEELLEAFLQPIEKADAFYQIIRSSTARRIKSSGSGRRKLLRSFCRSCWKTRRRWSATVTTPRARRFCTACSKTR